MRIHLIAPAGELHSFFRILGVENAAEMISLFQQYVGPEFQLTADLGILDAREDEHRGGRCDDQSRADDITTALADDAVAAIVAVRGGAWFTRILPRIDFSALDLRTRPVAVFGFSELTPLINIVAHQPMGRGYLDMGPAFLVYGLQRHAAHNLQPNESTSPKPHEWMQSRLRVEIRAHLCNVARLALGDRPPAISARLVRGSLPDATPASFVGGNLTVMSTLIGSRFAASIAPESRWLVLEDFNDKLERFDRFLAHFTLADYWMRCRGLLLGDFHHKETDLRTDILAMLDRHQLPASLPVMTTDQVGHTWPMTPLPLHRPGRWTRTGPENYDWRLEP